MCFCYYCICLDINTNKRIAYSLLPFIVVFGLVVLFVSAACHVKTLGFENYLRVNQVGGMVAGAIVVPICGLYFLALYKDSNIFAMICGIILGIIIFFHLVQGILELGQDKNQVKWSLEYMKKNNQYDYHEIERNYKCCGMKSYKDYLENEEKIPGTCCDGQKDNCEKSTAYKSGCIDAVSHGINILDLIVAGFLVLIITLELNLLALTLCIYLIIVSDCCKEARRRRQEEHNNT